jgi:hypothetical protein
MPESPVFTVLSLFPDELFVQDSGAICAGIEERQGRPGSITTKFYIDFIIGREL